MSDMKGSDAQQILAQRIVIDRLLYMTRFQPLGGQTMTIDEAVTEMLSECQGMFAEERREIIFRAAEAFKVEHEPQEVQVTYEAITTLNTWISDDIAETDWWKKKAEGWRKYLVCPPPTQKKGLLRRMAGAVAKVFR